MILGKWIYVATKCITDLINVFEANANKILGTSFVVMVFRPFIQKV